MGLDKEGFSEIHLIDSCVKRLALKVGNLKSRN